MSLGAGSPVPSSSARAIVVSRPAVSPVLNYGIVCLTWFSRDGTRKAFEFLARNDQIEEALDASVVVIGYNGWEFSCHVLFDAGGLRLEAFKRERL